MLRADENTAWRSFLAAAPRFAGEDVSNWFDGPDPPDVLCTGASGKAIGIELTKWVEHDQVTEGKGRELLESSYLKIIESEKVPRPDRIGLVHLHDKSLRIKQEDAAEFRGQLFALLAAENMTQDTSASRGGTPLPVPIWNKPQGAPVKDFSAFPTLEKYLSDMWIFPRQRLPCLPAGEPWVRFEASGRAYTPDWMAQAAIDRISAKIKKYEHDGIPAKHSLAEFDLLCYYCDEALLHNTPIDAPGFGFHELAEKVEKALDAEPSVFNKIFLFHPYEDIQVVQVYGDGCS